MKHFLLTLQTVLAASLLPFSPIHAQEASLDPQLAPLAAKYKSDVDALNAVRDQALASVRKPYLAALASAEKSTTASGKPDALKAVMEEKQTVTDGGALPPAPAPALPRDLASSRTSYIREVARIGHDFGARYQQASGGYLRALSPLETKARAGNQAALLERIAAEKMKITAQGAASTTAEASHPTGKNVLVNGEFSEKNPDGTPVGWTGTGTVKTENGVNFLQFPEASAKQSVECPVGKKAATISGRLRSSDFKAVGGNSVADHWFGLTVSQSDENGKELANNYCNIKVPQKSWKRVTANFKILSATKTLVVSISFYGATGTGDIADVQLEVR